jgi:probable phosphoglycerate mutase
MLSLWCVRHGQTDFSRRNTFCGSIDPPLSDVGRAMADALAARYGGEPWRAIFASPMVRTRQTVEPLARRAGIEPTIDPDLREIAYGSWEGREEAEVERSEGDAFHAWAQNPGWHPPPGGETGYQIAARVMAAIARIRAHHADGRVLIVSHKATLRVLACCLLGIDPNLFRARIAQPVASVTVWEFKKSGPLLARLGDVSHLPPELQSAEGT